MTDDLAVQLEEALREYVLQRLPPDPSGELADKGLADLLLVYGNWRARFVAPRSRRVHSSNKLRSNPKSAEHQQALEAIAIAVEAGDDITPHLSRRVRAAYQTASQRRKLHQREDRDLLIADWGVHHLHLSTAMDPDGFVARTEDLLFAAFMLDDAYFINVYSHGNWALSDVLKIIARNWPEAGIIQEIKGAIGLAQEFTDDDRLQLRNAGVATMIEIDGKVYAPPGQTTAGTPLAATLRVNQLMHALAQWRQLLHEDPGILDRVLSDEDIEPSNDRVWEPLVHRGEYGLVERQSGLFVSIALFPYA